MRIIVVGDTHGRPDWKRIIQNETFDHFIFIGDYFDSNEGLSFSLQKNNFTEIIKFKKENPEKVILLFGNHDFHYTEFANSRYSGYQLGYDIDIRKMMSEALNEKLFQLCYLTDTILISHAGITKTWCKENGIDISRLPDSVNEILYNKPEALQFKAGPDQNRNGDNMNQSPIWVRPPSLRADGLNGFMQVVGHTIQKHLEISLELILVDTLGTSGEYLIIEDGGIGTGSVKWHI